MPRILPAAGRKARPPRGKPAEPENPTVPKNDIQTLSPAALVALGQRIDAALGTVTPNPYLVPQDQRNDMRVTTASLSDLNTAVDDAKALYHGAVQAREAGRRAAADATAQVAKTIYAVPTNTPAMIADAGLSPRSTSRAKVLPSTPVELTALPQPNGGILLKWNRYDNPAGSSFIVEAQVGTGEWAYVQETSAARLSLTGYAPGTAVSFRVSASRNRQTSEPCAPVTLWTSSAGAPALRLAA